MSLATLQSVILAGGLFVGSLAPTQSSDPFEIPLPLAGWHPSTVAGAQRKALLIPGSYSNRDLNRAFIAGSINGNEGSPGLRQLLRERLHFDQVEVLTPREISPTGVRYALEDLLRGMTGSGNLLYVYWVGHGQLLPKHDSEGRVVKRDGEVVYEHNVLAYDSSPIRYNQLADLLAEVVGERTHEIETALFIDACARAHLDPGAAVRVDGTQTKHRPSLEVHSAGPGRLAYEDSNSLRSSFTAALVDALWRETENTREPILASRALELAMSAVKRQKPFKAGSDLTLYDPSATALRVEVVDEKGRPLTKARVSLLNQQLTGASVVFDRVPPAGRLGHSLRIEAPGYLPRTSRVKDFKPSRGSEVWRIPLVPDCIFLTGQVRQDPDATCIVGVPSAAASARDFHRMDAELTGPGSFCLRLPRLEGARQLVVQPESGSRRRVDFDLASLEPTVRRYDELENVTVYELPEPVDLRPAAPVGPALRLVTGRVDQPSNQSATIYVDGTDLQDVVFGSGSFLFPVDATSTRVDLIAKVDGELRDQVSRVLGPTSKSRLWGGRQTPLHELDPWVLPGLAIFVEGHLVLPLGTGPARIGIKPGPGGAAGFDADIHVLEQDQVVGPFRLLLPEVPGQIELAITGQGFQGKTVSLTFDRAEQTYRGGRRVRMVDLGEIQLKAGSEEPPPPTPDAEFDILRDREAYAKLDQRGVEALSRAAQKRWTKEFAGFTSKGVDRFSAGGLSHWISIWTHNGTGLEFVLVPGGRFQMGSPESERAQWPENNANGWFNDEKQHWVTLAPFLIARTECTQEAWVKGAEASLKSVQPHFSNKPSNPMENMSGYESRDWCEQNGFVLPTEAQWEYASRAGTTTAWTMSSNKNDIVGHGNVGSADCPRDWIDKGYTERWRDGYGDQSSPVGTFGPNAFGLVDVHGNVREWCRDYYQDYDSQPDTKTGLRTRLFGTRVIRGGSFLYSARTARSANRSRDGSEQRDRDLGFRPALNLP